MMIRYAKLSDVVLEQVALRLHYFENQDKIGRLATAREVSKAVAGGIDRYQSDDFMFRQRVMALASDIVAAIRDNEGEILRPPDPAPSRG